MIDKKLSPIEIYPKIFVYKNLFKDISSTYSELSNSVGGEDGLFSPWTTWSEFGEYLNPTFINQPPSLTIDYLKEIKTETEKQENQRLAILELFELFYAVTEDYALKNSVDLNKDSYVLTKNGDITQEWRMTGPSLARYRTDIQDPLAMTYHSDYIREPILSPGYKFTITALAYFNDNYEGGEIDFIVDGEAYMYKPEAGDFLVFPSGNPEILTKNGSVYIHGVMPATGESKYLSRMYWMKYYPGDDEWFEKEAEFGKDIWKDMQSDILKKFRKDNPNRISADKERRIK
jgi:hypothetical protein